MTDQPPRSAPPIPDFRCVLCAAVGLPHPVGHPVKGDPSGVQAAVGCPACGHVQLHPPQYDLGFYERDGQVAGVVGGYGTPLAKVMDHSWIEARRRVARFADHGIDLGTVSTVLDIGGGYGFFGAELLRHIPAARVTVMEPSATRADMGRAAIAAQTPPVTAPEFVVALLDEGFATAHQGQFDLVTLWHVLEHVPDPVALIRLALRLLRPGTGRLCIEVPNFADDLLTLSPAYRARHFMAEHISYFTHVTLEQVVRRADSKATAQVHGHQRYGIYNYFHWAHVNAPQGADPDMFPGTDRWWLESLWRMTKEQTRTSDALFAVVSPP